MTQSLAYILICLIIVALCVRPLGRYIARVYNGDRVRLSIWFGWLEHLFYRLCGTHEEEEMNWQAYAAGILTLGMMSFLFLFLLLLAQGMLPLNPEGREGLAPDLAFNVAISFVTNTNWQSYGGESALSMLSQMAGLAVQNFLSAAVGMAVAVALFRALSRRQMQTIGNPYVDVIRGTLYILLPLSIVFALFLASQGAVQNFSGHISFVPLEETAQAATLIAQGPAASQVAIKMLGSNGGGFFNANGAHPFENPTPLSNLLSIVAILLIPAALVYCFGSMVGDTRQAWTLLAAMLAIFVPLLLLTDMFEHKEHPAFDKAAVDQSAGNMEGKETRFGVTSSALWAVATTATSNGSVNAMHDSFTPLGGMIPLVFIQFGEVIFGGVGTGAYGMLMYVIITVFIGGLMVGRTPEYLGKKLGAFEIKMASLCILIPAASVLLGTAVAISSKAGVEGVFNPGAQGFTEILYAVASASNNNGSAFAGLNTNSPFYNTLLGIIMMIGRYGLIIPILALAGALVEKNKVPPSLGTLPTHTPLFTVMLVGSILLLDVLTYIPALALGPIAEHIHLYHVKAAP